MYEYLRFLCESGRSESERAGARRVKALHSILSLEVNLHFKFNIDFRTVEIIYCM